MKNFNVACRAHSPMETKNSFYIISSFICVYDDVRAFKNVYECLRSAEQVFFWSSNVRAPEQILLLLSYIPSCMYDIAATQVPSWFYAHAHANRM
jgi:hypothetical protein